MVSIVIADDELDLKEIMTEFFTSINIDVLETVNNGKDAIESCIKFSPDYLLLDLNMSDYDGFYTLENLQKIENIPKIILITGEIDIPTEKLKNYGDLVLLTKPFTLRGIADIILGTA